MGCLLAALAATFLLAVLAASILQRRQEAVPQRPLVPIGDWEMDAAKWGVDFPREYETYKLMADSTGETKYGGAAQRDYLAATPANVDPLCRLRLRQGLPPGPRTRPFRRRRDAKRRGSTTKRRPRAGPARAPTCRG